MQDDLALSRAVAAQCRLFFSRYRTRARTARIAAQARQVVGELATTASASVLSVHYWHREMMIFISYRRLDTAEMADSMYRVFASIYGSQNVFIDVCSIRLGLDFEEALCDALIACDVFLPLIGTKWVGNIPCKNTPRIQDPRDFVYREVLSAIRFGLTIIPIMIDDSEMPPSDVLPANIRSLSTMQGRRILSTRKEVQLRSLAEEMNASGFHKRPVTAFAFVEEGEFWKDIRAAGITIADLARKAGIRVNILHQVIRGRNIRRETAKKIFKVVRQYSKGLMFTDIFRPV